MPAKAFNRKVLKVVSLIPRGRTLSYKEVAKLAGSERAWRAVGNILNKNYNSAVPCHRVVRSDGKCGGYNRGAAKKRHLLLYEKFSKNGSREVLGRAFFTRPTLTVAQDLLGKYIVRKIGRREIEGKIIETEAYIGPRDRASHAYLPRHMRHKAGEGKKTQRNLAEYLEGGHIYIYLVYGMYWQLNFSTSGAGKPECVLIRALELNDAAEEKLANGPGKLCRYLKLDKSFYGKDLTKGKRIWLEDRGEAVSKSAIGKSARIGIDYAGPYWSKIKWRFFVKKRFDRSAS